MKKKEGGGARRKKKKEVERRKKKKRRKENKKERRRSDHTALSCHLSLRKCKSDDHVRRWKVLKTCAFLQFRHFVIDSRCAM